MSSGIYPFTLNTQAEPEFFTSGIIQICIFRRSNLQDGRDGSRFFERLCVCLSLMCRTPLVQDRFIYVESGFCLGAFRQTLWRATIAVTLSGGGLIAGQIEEEKKVRDDGRGKDSKRRGKSN